MIAGIFCMLRRRVVAGGIGMIIVLALLACAGRAESYELVLLHTNDSHGSVLPVDSVGGLAERATFIRQVREQSPCVLLVDAGDINAGQPVSNMANARPDILAYNYMGYDAVTVGNHEFDKPVSVLLKQMKEADFPFVISNIEIDERPLGREFLLKEIGGIKVGLFGLTTKYTEHLSVYAREVVFKDEAEAARRMVKVLKEKRADVIIALVHLGFTEMTPEFITSRKLAGLVDGIDILVDGHSHSYLDKPERVNNTWIVTANQSGRYVGEGKLVVKDGHLAGFDWKPVHIKGFAADTALRRILKPFLDSSYQDLKVVAGVATDEFFLFSKGRNVARFTESALGGLIADALKWKVNGDLKLRADFGLINSGGIRAGLPAGEVTKGDVLTTLPFSNELEVVALKGNDVRRMFDYLATVTPGNGAFAQISEDVRIVYDRKAQKVISLAIGGNPVADTATYYMATCDYVASGREGYGSVFAATTRHVKTSLLISDVLIDYIKMKGQISPVTDDRILIAR